MRRPSCYRTDTNTQECDTYSQPPKHNVYLLILAKAFEALESGKVRGWKYFEWQGPAAAGARRVAEDNEEMLKEWRPAAAGLLRDVDGNC